MTHNDDSTRLVNGTTEAACDDFLWGAEAIGKPINRNKRQTHHLLTRGEIKSASRAALLRELGA
jgi:hypothetical protein